MENNENKPTKTQAALIGILTAAAAGSVVEGALKENAGREAAVPKASQSILIEKKPELTVAGHIKNFSDKVKEKEDKGGSLNR